MEDELKFAKEVVEFVTESMDDPELFARLKTVGAIHNCTPEALRAMILKMLGDNLLKHKLYVRFHPYR